MRYLLNVVCCWLVASSMLASAEDSPPSEAWVAFATADYFRLLEVTIASVHAFSTRPIIAVGVNEDIPFSTQQYPRLIKKRVDVDLKKESVFNQKPRSILESGVDFGVYIEADDILIAGCDTLFAYAHRERPYPLCPTHGQDPNNQERLMEVLNVSEKSMPYVHGHVIFSKQCMPFIKEWLDHCLEYRDFAINADETILNVLLWKHQVTEQVPAYDPYYYGSLGPYLKLTPEAARQSPYSSWKMFHGCKNPIFSWWFLQVLVDHHKKQPL